jgi:hypothetical protein
MTLATIIPARRVRQGHTYATVGMAPDFASAAPGARQILSVLFVLSVLLVLCSFASTD